MASYTANLAAFFTMSGRKVNGPQDMLALKASVICDPIVTNSNQLAELRDQYAVNNTVGGVITAIMPDEVFTVNGGESLTVAQLQALAYSAPSLARSAALEEMKRIRGLDLVAVCAEKVSRGEANSVVSFQSTLAGWLYDRSHPERCRNFEFSRGVQLDSSFFPQIFIAVNKTVGWPFFQGVQDSLAWLRSRAPSQPHQPLAYTTRAHRFTRRL